MVRFFGGGRGEVGGREGVPSRGRGGGEFASSVTDLIDDFSFFFSVVLSFFEVDY